jgi:protein-disulfide isomerase
MNRSERQARLERRRGEARRGQLKWIVYVVVAAVVLAGMMIYANRVRPAEQRVYNEPHGISLGNPDAPVQLIEYADFQCPHCRNVHAATEYQIIQEYVDTGKVFFTYRLVGFLDNPVAGAYESSRSAEAAYCAADQEVFWPFHDVVFANFSAGNRGGYADERLIDMAVSAGAEESTFRSCLLNSERAGDVEAAMSEANTLGITGTPGFVINGSIMTGERSFAQLQEAIEAALTAAGAN